MLNDLQKDISLYLSLWYKMADMQKETNSNRSDFVMERIGRIEEMDRSFDIEFWQRQGDAAIFQAAWELVEFYLRDRGASPDEYRLQRTIEHLERSPS